MKRLKPRREARFTLPLAIIKQIGRMASDEDVRAHVIAERLIRQGLEREKDRRKAEPEPEPVTV